jgi:hypothetical protein
MELEDPTCHNRQLLFKVVIIILRLTPLSFICSTVEVPIVLSITITWHGCHNAFMKEITKAKVSLPPRDIHKSIVVVQVMQLANIKFTKFSMVLVTKACNTSLINWCLDGKTTFPHLLQHQPLQ